MSKYITRQEINQEGTEVSLPRMSPEVGTWREKKLMTYRLSELYELAGMEKESKRAAFCSTFMTFGVTAAGSRRLLTANSCKLRLCPICTERKAHRMAAELSEVMDRLVLERPNVRFLFLTLTMDNCPGSDLRYELGHLASAWDKLLRHRELARAIGGWFRALEITREKKRSGYYHPHIHAILAVDPGYFDKKLGLYLNHDSWLEHWRKALDVPYRPSVRVQKTVSRSATADASQDASELSAAKEAAKYPLKATDYISTRLPKATAAEIVTTYSQAVRGKRFTAYGGWMKEIAKDVEISASTDSIRSDVAILAEDYHWNFGARDYIFEGARGLPQDPALRADEGAATSTSAKLPDQISGTQLRLDGFNNLRPS